MKERLESRLGWLKEYQRELVLGEILAELDNPTPFMLEAGSLAFAYHEEATLKARLRWAFRAMVSEARKGG